MLSHGNEVLLVKPGNATALAHALSQMASSSAMRLAMGVAALAPVAGHSYRDQAIALERLFSSGTAPVSEVVPLVALLSMTPSQR